MKTRRTIVLAGLILIAATATLAAGETAQTIPAITIEEMKLTPSQLEALKLKLPSAENSKTVSFTGGYVIGAVEEDKENKTIGISGDVWFILSKDNKGGVIKFEISEYGGKPVDMTLNQYPFDMKPESTALDGRPVEIAVGKGKPYILMNIKKGAEITIKNLEFKESSEMSDPEQCGCLQIKISKTSATNAALSVFK